MKKLAILICAITLMFGMAGNAAAVLFDFDSLQNNDDSSAIGSYMTNTYGSNITVTGATAIKGYTGPPGLFKIGTDPFIAGAGVPYEIEIVFDNPIQSIGFDWLYNNEYFKAYADDNLFFLTGGPNISGVGYYGACFINPVSKINFTDSGIGLIGVDNLDVTPATADTPEPATMLLLGSGLVGMAGFGRKKFFKR